MLANRVITSIFWACSVNAKAESLLSLPARDPVTQIATLTSLVIGKHWMDSSRPEVPVSLQEKPGTTVLHDLHDFYDLHNKSHNVEIRWQQKQQITLCSQHSFMMYALPDDESPDIRLRLLPFNDQAGYCTKILLDSPEGFARFLFDGHQASVNPLNSIYTLNNRELPLNLLQVNTAPDLSVSGIHMIDRKRSRPHLQLRFSCDLWPAEFNTNCKTLILDSRHYKISQRGGNGGGTSGNGKGESDDKQGQQQPRDKETKETKDDKGGSGRQGGDASGGDKDPPKGSGSGAHKKINTSFTLEQAKRIIKQLRKLLKDGVNQYNAQSVVDQFMGQLSQISHHDLNSLFEEGYSLLHDVITHFPSDFEPLIYQLVANLLESGVNALALDHQGNTAFHLAASQGLYNVLELMLNVYSEYDSSFLNYANDDQRTPLMLAAMNGYNNIVLLLIKHQANLSQVTNYGVNAMHLAACNGQAETVKVLSNHMTEAQIDCPTSWGVTALHLAAKYGHVNVISILRGKGADPNAKANDDNTPVGLAIHSGHVDATRELFDSGAVVKDTSPEANVWKESMNKPELFEVVFARCANEPEQSCHETEVKFADEGKSYCDKHTQLLFVAVKSKRKPDIIRIIATEGNPDLNKPDKNGRRLLHQAVDQQDTDLTRTLLKLGADINMQTVNDPRNTALHIAAENLSQELVKTLLDFKPNLEVVNNHGHTAFSETAQNLRRRARYSQYCERTDNYLNFKYSKKYIHILELLANAGADVEHRNKQGKTAIASLYSSVWTEYFTYIDPFHLKTLKETVNRKKKEREAAQQQEQKRKEKEHKEKEREEKKRKERERKEQKQRDQAKRENNLQKGKTVEKESKF